MWILKEYRDDELIGVYAISKTVDPLKELAATEIEHGAWLEFDNERHGHYFETKTDGYGEPYFMIDTIDEAV